MRCRRTGFAAHRDDLRRGPGRWYRGEGRTGDGLVGAHRGGRLDPHPHVVGLVQRDRNGVDPEEVGGRQHAVHGVVGGQLRQGRHGGQRDDVGSGRGLVLGGGRRTVGAGPHQPAQIRGVGGDVPLGAGALPGTGLHARQNGGQFVGDVGVFGAQRRPRRGGGQQ